MIIVQRMRWMRLRICDSGEPDARESVEFERPARGPTSLFANVIFGTENDKQFPLSTVPDLPVSFSCNLFFNYSASTAAIMAEGEPEVPETHVLAIASHVGAPSTNNAVG
jgi:hypothetical protein